MNLYFIRSKTFTVRKGCRAFVDFYVSNYNECGVACRRCSRREFTLARTIKRYINDHSTEKEGAIISLEVADSNCDSTADITIHNVHLSAKAYSLFEKRVKNFMEIIHCKCWKDLTDTESDSEVQEDGKTSFPDKLKKDDQNLQSNPAVVPRLLRLQRSKKDRNRRTKTNRSASLPTYPFQMSDEDLYSSTSANASFLSEQSGYDSDQTSAPSSPDLLRRSKDKMNRILNPNPAAVSQGSEEYLDLLPNATADSPFYRPPQCLEDDTELQPNSTASTIPPESSKDNLNLLSHLTAALSLSQRRDDDPSCLPGSTSFPTLFHPSQQQTDNSHLLSHSIAFSSLPQLSKDDADSRPDQPAVRPLDNMFQISKNDPGLLQYLRDFCKRSEKDQDCLYDSTTTESLSQQSESDSDLYLDHDVALPIFNS